MEITKSNTINSAILGIYRLLIIFSVLAVLSLGQSIVIPIALAALFTFLLSPLVTILEKWLGRVISILLVVIVVFSTIGLAGYMFTRQLMLLGANFPVYYERILEKLSSFHFPEDGIFQRIARAFGNIKDRIFEDSVDVNAKVSPIEAKLMELSSIFTSFIESFFGSFFHALGMAAIVILLVIFMLLTRDDIRSRIIKLMGEGRISSATNALDDASERLLNFLFRQFIVNIVFGIAVSTGLYLIGIPNAILWGCLAFIMRFIPYVGPPIAMSFPIILSFIIGDTFALPILTISFFIILEVITAYFIEPFYYGKGTGVSAFALIMAAIFWTWLWGPVGLLLSTPLTVCLVVIGQYVPNMNFLRILLSKEEALTPPEEAYYRLLSYNTSESMDVVESYLKKNSLISLYDTVLIPVITQTELDLHLGLIDADKKEVVYQGVSEIIEFLGIREHKEAVESHKNVLCLPAHSIRDELGVNILSQILANESFEVHYTTKLNVSDIFELVKKRNPDVVCIVAVAPFVFSHIRYLCNKLHNQMPELPIVVALWGYKDAAPENLNKLSSEGVKVALSLHDVVRVLKDTV